MTRKNLFKSVIATLLALVMVFGVIETGKFSTAKAAQTAAAGTINKVVDLDTSLKYSESLGDNASTEFSGRIWTDKSVYSDSVTFATFGGGTETINKADNEDFLIAYSALGTSKAVSGETHAPVDVVFIIDISGSMSNSDSRMDNGLSRIANTVTAVNASIDKLMAMNDYTRVAVVVFSDTATTLLPLDHYAKRTSGNTTYDYLTLNSQYAGGNVELTVRARGDEEGNINEEIDVSGGTNIQAGLYEGMNVLASAQDTTADINGSSIKRVPSVILLSDGAPTYSSGNSGNTQSNWWQPLNNNNDGPGNSSYYGNGFKALMTGAYMKNAINEKYGVAGTNMQTTLYTVGMGITDIDNYETGFFGYQSYTGEQDLAYMTLNPGGNWNSDNDMAEDIRDAWTRYTNQTPGSNSTITVQTSSNENYTVRHPRSPLQDIYTTTDKDALKNLVDGYYAADNASTVTNVFDQIVSSISISAPEVPTELRSDDFMNTGFITYTDPIGEYMSVKDVKAIIYAGTTFTQKTKTESGNTTTYIFEGTVESAVYGNQDIENIIITVTKDANGNETLTVKIPAGVIPLRVNTVTLNADGSVKTHTNNGAYPARVIYSVAMKDGLKKVCDHGEVYVDLTKVSADYVKNNINADGTINFYSNLYTGTNQVNGSTAGNAYVEFEPSHTNPFYYVLENMPIYKDANLTQQLPASEGIDENTTYYYNDTYYHGTSVETRAIARTGKQLLNLADSFGDEGAFVTVGGYIYRKPGSPRLNRILRFEGTKTLNATNTAEDFYGATFVHADGSTNPYEGRFVVYLGNNGVMSLLGGGNLKVTKIVDSSEGVTAPDKEFTFTLDLNGNQVSELVLNYAVTDASGNQVRTGTLSKNANTFTLKDGQSATIFSLPPETTYTVTENTESGFATNAVNATGTILANETSEAVFTNTYSVESVTLPESRLSVTKTLTGRSWADGDSFTFFINPYNNAPLPTGYNKETGITITKDDVTGTTDAEFTFGSITFTLPGTYRYTIYEDEPENNAYLPGMSYSRALYRVEIIVEDDGAGKLTFAKTDIQKLYTDDAEQLFHYGANNEIVMNQGEESQDPIHFINTYKAESVTRVPVALKNYTDLSGNKPLVSGMFEFKLQAVGYKLDGGTVINDITKVPMPANAVNGISTTTNEGHNVTFPHVEFTQTMLNNLNTSKVIYYYQMSEVVPDGADANNKLNGMIYDSTKFDIAVEVSIDPNSSTLVVNAIYPNDVHIATFKNTYLPEPVETDINGTKIFNGRNTLQGESFEFTLTGADEFTINAIGNSVVIPNSTVTVDNLMDGYKDSFSFSDIQFKKPGTYKFKVAETKGTLKGVTYDESVITVTIVVEDNNGVLKVVSKSYSNGSDSADFVNTYTATFTGTPVSLQGTKNLLGKTLLAGEFYFEIAGFAPDGTEIMRSYVTHTEDVQADANGVYSGTINFFENMTFDMAGTYRFYITESNNNVPNTEYDTAQYIFYVEIEDDNQGNLKVKSTELYKADKNVSPQPANEIVFTNTYTPNPLTVTIPVGRKVIDGDRAIGLQAGEFKFMLSVKGNADGVTLPHNIYAFNDASGHITFDDITFSKAGTYTIVISEVIPDVADRIPGITYNTEQHELTYRVVDDRIGNLTAILTTLNNTVIVNGYTAQKTEPVNIEISKDLSGRQWLNSDEFSFKVQASDEETKQAIKDGIVEIQLDANSEDTATKAITTKGAKATVPVTFNKIGTYKFKVTEIKGNISGVDYDESVYEVTIVVTDNSQRAHLEATVTITKDTENVQTIVFENIYKAKEFVLPGETNLKVQKDFTGRKNNAWLESDEFTFNITGADNNTLTAIANGDITFVSTSVTLTSFNKDNAFFGDITFKKAGTYKFKVTETKGTIPGVTYDENELYVTVEVTDNVVEGKLEATVIASQSDELIFSNLYTIDPNGVKVVLKDGKKVLKGRDLKDKEFTFIVKDENGKTVMTLTNDKFGALKFNELIFTEEGTYTYTVSEVNGEDSKTSYDETVYTVTVVVTDNTLGKLEAETTVKKANATVETITFNNIALSDPKPTGDSFNSILMLALISLTTGFVVTTVVKKKKDNE